MPILSKRELFRIVEQSIKESGWGILHYPMQEVHSKTMQIFRGDESYRIRVYIWNLTHGGGQARPTNEYRIQVTGVDQFEQAIDERTLILGWWNELGVFAAFDFNRHSGRLGASPSIQIREEFLILAHERGMAPCNKGNQEIAMAVRPDFLVQYVKECLFLHQIGDSQNDFDLLETISDDPFAVNDDDLERATRPRRKMMSNIRRVYRDTLFRGRVLNSYRYRCAMCGIQLDLVEAAHIIPVIDERSTDETCNGIALCGVHHSAFDRTLIGVREDYRVRVNGSEVHRLGSAGRTLGLDAFRQGLRQRILLPNDIRNRPNTNYIRIANEIRGWANDR